MSDERRAPARRLGYIDWMLVVVKNLAVAQWKKRRPQPDPSRAPAPAG